MCDEHGANQAIGRNVSEHGTVRHRQKGFALGNIHYNTAESLHAALERAKFGAYHWMSKGHLPLYTAEAACH